MKPEPAAYRLPPTSRVHVTYEAHRFLNRTHWALFVLNDSSLRALSPEAAAVVLRKSQQRIRRKLRRSLDR
jgi:hypothetical protein